MSAEGSIWDETMKTGKLKQLMLGIGLGRPKLENSSNIYFAMPWESKNWKTHVDY